MAESTNGELKVWTADLFSESTEYADAQAGICRFAPGCGGVQLPSGKTTRADFETCPGAPAEFAERIGMTEHPGSGMPRYMAICRSRAEKRFGVGETRAAEAEVVG
jgi:hypothetical protein